MPDSGESAKLTEDKSLKKSKHATSGSKLTLMETAMSEVEELEDIMFLFSDTDESGHNGKGKAPDVVML